MRVVPVALPTSFIIILTMLTCKVTIVLSPLHKESDLCKICHLFIASVHSIVVVGVYVAFFTATTYSCLLTLLEQYFNTLYTPTTTIRSRDIDSFMTSRALSSCACAAQHALANKKRSAHAYEVPYCAVNRILYAMHILVVAPVRACLWLHDCLVCIILQALNVLRQLHRGFCTIVLHFYSVGLPQHQNGMYRLHNTFMHFQSFESLPRILNNTRGDYWYGIIERNTVWT